VHGFPLDRSMWAGELCVLSDAARVIAPDLRGFGQTAPAAGATSIASYAADVRSLLDALAIDRAVVGGVSMGGYVALAFARLFPERLRGLVLVDTRAAADSAEARRGRDESAALVRSAGPAALAERMVPKLLCAATLRAGDSLPRLLYGIVERQGVDGIVAALAALRDRPDATPALRGIAVPTLVVHGEDDAVIPLAEARSLAAAIPGARLEVLPEAGHLPNLERPLAFHRAVREFMRTISKMTLGMAPSRRS
jgi:3-oxoadipate enol-lactonase